MLQVWKTNENGDWTSYLQVIYSSFVCLIKLLFVKQSSVLTLFYNDLT